MHIFFDENDFKEYNSHENTIGAVAGHMQTLLQNLFSVEKFEQFDGYPYKFARANFEYPLFNNSLETMTPWIHLVNANNHKFFGSVTRCITDSVEACFEQQSKCIGHANYEKYAQLVENCANPLQTAMLMGRLVVLFKFFVEHDDEKYDPEEMMSKFESSWLCVKGNEDVLSTLKHKQDEEIRVARDNEIREQRKAGERVWDKSTETLAYKSNDFIYLDKNTWTIGELEIYLPAKMET